MTSSIKVYVHYLIIFSLMLFFKYIPAPEGLTTLSMDVIGIFLGTLYGWITVGMGWPSLIGIVFFGLSDFTNMPSALQSAFGGQIIVMVMGLLLFSAFVQQSDITDFILDFLMKRKSCQGRPYVLLFYFFLAGYIASLLSYCTAVFIIFIGFFKAMLDKVGIKPYEKAVPCLLIGMIIAILFPELALPFKSTSIYCIGTYEAVTGTKVDIVKYIAFMFPMSVGTIIVHLLACKYIFRLDLSGFANYKYEAKNAVKLSKRQKFSLVAIGLAMLGLLIPGLVPADSFLYPLMNQLGTTGFTLVIVVCLMLVRVDNEPLMDLAKIAAYYPWNIYLCMAFLFTVAPAISSDVVGIKAILTENGKILFSSLPIIITVILFIFMPAFLTNFMNNAVIGIISLTIYGTIASDIAINPYIVFCLLAYAAQIGFFFPAANPMTTIAFAQTDIVTFKQMLGYGLLTWLIQCCFLGLGCMTWGSLIL